LVLIDVVRPGTCFALFCQSQEAIMAENDIVLHKLISCRSFEEVERLLKSPKGPELAQQKDENGNLPLHCVAIACRIASTDLMIDLLLNLLLQIHPEGLKEKNQNGDLPFHIITKWIHVVRHSRSNAMKFLKIYPEGAGVKDGTGLLPIEYALQFDRFDFVQLIAKYYPKCLALQVCQCPLAQIDGCIVCNDKHPLMTRIRESGRSSSSHEKLLNIWRFLNSSLAVTHHPDDVHKILQLEDSLASEKQQVKDLKLRVKDLENKSIEKNERLESQKERNHSLKAQVTKTQQHLDSEKQRNQTRNTENATLQAQVTEIQQQLDDNEIRTREQIDGILSLLVESGAESYSNLPIPSLKHLIKIFCLHLDSLSLSDGGEDRKPSFAQSVGPGLVESENASKDTLMQCIQALFSECAQAEGGDHQDAAGQGATTARVQTSGAARRKRNDNSSPDHQGSQDDAAGCTTRKKRARVSVSPEQEQR
jgi:hypothetical protein